MAVVWKAHDNLLALVELANNGLGTIIRPRPNLECFLYTEDLNEEKHNIIQMGIINPRNNLYYFDLRELLKQDCVSFTAAINTKKMVIKKNSKVSQSTLRKVYRLHQQLNHRNFRTSRR
jgi:hypothetical protein